MATATESSSAAASAHPRLFPGSSPPVCSSSVPLDYSSFVGHFSCFEYLDSLLRCCPANVERLIELPPECDRDLFVYEHLRVLVRDLGMFCAEISDCQCPAMTATADWEFLCAAHAAKPRKCSAVDYAIHALAGFTSLLANSDLFPNRVSISASSAKYFPSVVRRLYRIFAHAAFHHQEKFQKLEEKSHLAERFVKLSLKFQLMDRSQLTPPIPGIAEPSEDEGGEK